MVSRRRASEKKQKNRNPSHTRLSSHQPVIRSMAPISFTREQLRDYTSEFNGDNELGIGEFSVVYQGLTDYERIAVKAYNFQPQPQIMEHWEREKEYLPKFQHPHIIDLKGYCEDEGNYFLVYEYMLGAVTKVLEELDWSLTLKVLRESASALCYIHTCSYPLVVFADFKLGDILIDEEYNVKVTDFGMVRQQEEIWIPFCTPGCTDPEIVMKGKGTQASDIYSFGIVILQLIMKLDEVIDKKSGEHISDWAREEVKKRKHAVDEFLRQTGCSKREAIKITRLAMRCLSRDPNARPTFSEVIEALDQLHVQDVNKFICRTPSLHCIPKLT